MERKGEQRRGFLHENFRVFHLKDTAAPSVDYHYHEFDKLVLLLSGKVTYWVEDEAHELRPGDLLFVPHGSIHRPVIEAGEVYERYVVWMMPGFLSRLSRPGQSLSLCFDGPTRKVGLDLQGRMELAAQMDELSGAAGSADYAAELLTEALFVRFMVSVNRCLRRAVGHMPGGVSDPKIAEVRAFIDGHLGEDLSVERLSAQFYMSRYHMMRKFKAQCGSTLHQYITRKRLLAAAELIAQGASAAKAAEQCGYDDYSAFLRAFKRTFQVTPRHFAGQLVRRSVENE